MPFAATWMELEIIILSEVSQTKTNITYMQNLKKKKPKTKNLKTNETYLHKGNRPRYIANKLMVSKGES